tara:strand:+ start:839 stop:1603 length:765 start_codon:yes stop_codon:yes gene_type:complete
MNYFVALAAILFVYMSLWFVVSLIKKRNDVADVAWGLGFVVLAWAAVFISAGSSMQGILVVLLVTIWGVRLAWHIAARHKGKGEDYRYRVWRETWGAWFYPRSYLQVYMLQGALLFLVALPIVVIIGATVAPNLFTAVGVGVWLLGFAFEVIGDRQLKQFIKNSADKGKLMTSGLWRYTRHPNYFGEVTLWWGIWLVALSVPYGWATIVGPLTITFLILKVSGVPLLEKKMAEHPDFAEYKRTTSVFIPWFKTK